MTLLVSHSAPLVKRNPEGQLVTHINTGKRVEMHTVQQGGVHAQVLLHGNTGFQLWPADVHRLVGLLAGDALEALRQVDLWMAKVPNAGAVNGYQDVRRMVQAVMAHHTVTVNLNASRREEDQRPWPSGGSGVRATGVGRSK